MDYSVIIVGGGMAGLSAARALGRAGIKVLLVEKNTSLGGRAAGLACLATAECQKCGACLPGQVQPELPRFPEFSVLTGHEAQAILRPAGFKSETGSAPHFPLYTVNLRPVGLEGSSAAPKSYTAPALLIASGFQPFAAELRGEFGCGRYPGVVSSLDLEKVWQEHGSLYPVYGELSRVAFIQCVGSRDRRAGNPYCSKVCCEYAGRMARRLRWESALTSVTVFHQDFQARPALWSALTSTDPGITLIRALPAQAYQLPGQGVVLDWEDALAGKNQTAEFDLVVLSIGITAGGFNAVAERDLGIIRDQGGFLAATDLAAEASVLGTPEASRTAGIFLAGTCTGPADLPTVFAQGQRAAGQIIEYLRSGPVTGKDG